MEQNTIEKELIEVESNLQGIFNAAHNGDAESYEILLKIKEAIGSILRYQSPAILTSCFIISISSFCLSEFLDRISIITCSKSSLAVNLGFFSLDSLNT